MDQNKLDELERLARLKADGALNDSEYSSAKTALLARPDVTTLRASAFTMEPRIEAPIDETQLSDTWRQRFEFIDQHGMPSSKSYGKAFRALSFWDRARIVSSPLGFLFGPFYFVYLGLWRPALSMLGGSVIWALVLAALDLPASFDRLSYLVPAVLYGYTVIPLYYLRVRRGLHSWNPFIWWRA